MKVPINKKINRIRPSGIRAFFELVLGMRDVISLGVGEPDFVTPWNIREAAIFSLEEGDTSYTSNKGLYELRHDIARHLEYKYNLTYNPDEEILVTVGVSEAFDLALRVLINPGDKILIPQPSYVSYGPIVTLCGGTPVLIATKAEDGFKIHPKELRGRCDKKTKALVLNYPNNPTGASYTKWELREIANVVSKQNLTVISDEIYGELTYDFTHTPFSRLPRMKERTVYLNGFSKAYAMTGFRIGFACGPREVIAAMTKIHQYTMLCVPIASQLAAREALRHGEKSVQEMKREYKRRRALVVDALRAIGLSCHVPAGAFYTFPSIRNVSRLDSIAFARRLLKEEKVAVVPGCAFGRSGEGYIRIAYAASIEQLKEAFQRIKHFIERHR